MNKGIAYLLSCVHTNGAIYREPSEDRKGGGLSNYNTALAMVALHEADRPDLANTVLRARAFVAASQHLGDDEYRGGMGYDPDTGRAYADLSNSYVAYEAMKLTEQLEDLRKTTGDTDLDWDAAIAFASGLQNRDGGFIYAPGESKAGSVTNEQGEVRFRAYGSMTYAGLLSLIYAEVDRDDPRIKSAFDWATNHWSLEENPGMGSQGLYYFYNVLAKGLAVYGEEVFKTHSGKNIHWREDLIRKLVGLQRIDAKTGAGYWVNEEGRWWEQDPVLVTSYALIALEIASGE
jgi:squalene-hopene/tetraprenyl-beta-curcumene cyclase